MLRNSSSQRGRALVGWDLDAAYARSWRLVLVLVTSAGLAWLVFEPNAWIAAGVAGYLVASAPMVRWVIRGAMAGLAWCLALVGVTMGGCGLILALGHGGIALIAVAVLTHPRLAARLADSITKQRCRGHDTPVLVSGDPERVTTRGLVCAWQTSTAALAHVHDPGERAELAERRRCFLEVLEARDPAGVQRWLTTTTTRDMLDPRPFLLTPHGTGSAPGHDPDRAHLRNPPSG